MRDYRYKIDFLKHTTGHDDYGEPVDSWQVFKQGIWSSKDPLLGNEYFTALTNDTKVEVKFNMRYIDGITNDMRILHGTEVYEILSAVNVKGLNRELLCYCKLEIDSGNKRYFSWTEFDWSRFTFRGKYDEYELVK